MVIVRRIQSGKGKTRGRKPIRKNEKFMLLVLSNGDTRNELLKRSRYALTQTPDKWSERQKLRMKLLFELYPRIKEAYDIINKPEPSSEVRH